jgi:hypothetical protein
MFVLAAEIEKRSLLLHRIHFIRFESKTLVWKTDDRAVSKQELTGRALKGSSIDGRTKGCARSRYLL